MSKKNLCIGGHDFYECGEEKRLRKIFAVPGSQSTEIVEFTLWNWGKYFIQRREEEDDDPNYDYIVLARLHDVSRRVNFGGVQDEIRVQPMVSDIFRCGYRDLLGTIIDILSRTPAPKEYHKLIIKKIFPFVVSYIQGLACRNCDRRVTTIAIDIKYVGLLFNVVPACKSSIEALEKVRFECQENVEEECVICWDAFEDGCEVTRLPCSHIFHGDCIVDWLKRSHACPFCRYQFSPSAEDFRDDLIGWKKNHPRPCSPSRIGRLTATPLGLQSSNTLVTS